MDQLSQCQGFQWDEGNSEKNWITHKVARGEAEQVFFNRPLVVRAGDEALSKRSATMPSGTRTRVDDSSSYSPCASIWSA